MKKETALKTLTAVSQHTFHHIETTFRILKAAGQSFTRSTALEATAGLAYYSMFSLFPLVLLLVAISSNWLEIEHVQEQAITFVADLFPISHEMIQQMINTMVERRRAVTFISIVGLLWASSGFFNLLVRNLNRAWPELKTRHFVTTRLEAILIVIALGALFILSLLATSAYEVMGHLRLPFWETIFNHSPLKRFLSEIVPLLVRMAMLWGLYYWIPKTEVNKHAAFWGALSVTVAWRLVTSAFTWYLSSGLAQYDFIYGSLGTTIISMFWLYLSNYTLLFGAHISVAISKEKKAAANLS